MAGHFCAFHSPLLRSKFYSDYPSRREHTHTPKNAVFIKCAYSKFSVRRTMLAAISVGLRNGPTNVGRAHTTSLLWLIENHNLLRITCMRSQTFWLVIMQQRAHRAFAHWMGKWLGIFCVCVHESSRVGGSRMLAMCAARARAHTHTQRYDKSPP